MGKVHLRISINIHGLEEKLISLSFQSTRLTYFIEADEENFLETTGGKL